MHQAISIFWFRRDLRLFDNAGLYHALKSGTPVLPLFIFDTDILDDLEDKADKRLAYIHDNLANIHAGLVDMGSSLLVEKGTPIAVFKTLLSRYTISAVYTNEDYEPYALKRDSAVAELLREHGIAFHAFKDQVVFARQEVLKDDGNPYTVYTPYSKQWKKKVNDFYLKEYPTERYFAHLHKTDPLPFPSIQQIGFEPVAYDAGPTELNRTIAATYDKTRNLPGIVGTTKLSVHLRFGTISVRRLATQLRSINETALNELIWREFFSAILFHFPNTVHAAFKPAYDDIKWRNNEAEFAAWCSGNTGYPMVDAGMRELNETGWMHNRSRLITGSFLAKHLLIDWRRGEAYFAKKLMDYDLSQNVGNWQWVAGCGVDAAPYFRIFNPMIQQEKFDPELRYIRRWIPEFGTAAYPKPIVDHDHARQRCLEVYKAAVSL